MADRKASTLEDLPPRPPSPLQPPPPPPPPPSSGKRKRALTEKSSAAAYMSPNPQHHHRRRRQLLIARTAPVPNTADFHFDMMLHDAAMRSLDSDFKLLILRVQRMKLQNQVPVPVWSTYRRSSKSCRATARPLSPPSREVSAPVGGGGDGGDVIAAASTLSASSTSRTETGTAFVCAEGSTTCSSSSSHPQTLVLGAKMHWDFLLEEMAWMRLDFRYERRWKMENARRAAGWASWACKTRVRERGAFVPVQDGGFMIMGDFGEELREEKVEKRRGFSYERWVEDEHGELLCVRRDLGYRRAGVEESDADDADDAACRINAVTHTGGDAVMTNIEGLEVQHDHDHDHDVCTMAALKMVQAQARRSRDRYKTPESELRA